MVDEKEAQEQGNDLFSEALKRVEEVMGHPLSAEEREKLLNLLHEVYANGLVAGRSEIVQNYIEGYRTAVMDLLPLLRG